MKELLYVLPGGMENAGAAWGLTPARMDWRVLPGHRLAGGGTARGGAMVLACGEDPGPGDPVPLCRQVVRECRRRGMDRVICDFEGPAGEGAERLAEALWRLCGQSGLPLYLPEPLAPAAPGCRVLVSSQVTGETLEGRLRHALERYGEEQAVLAVEAGASDFPLPAAGEGRPMSRGELRSLMERAAPAVFYDRGLCAHYFTYVARESEAHFILFDTPRSVRAKLDAAQRLGVRSALLAAPQVGDWLEELFG